VTLYNSAKSILLPAPDVTKGALYDSFSTRTYTVIGRVLPAFGEDFDKIPSFAQIDMDLAVLLVVFSLNIETPLGC
jgi:sulfite exporter TauE/SafE